jgi:NADH-quinone oxidoreductase subunit E
MKMAKTTDTRQDSGAADASADLARIAADMLRNAPVMPIHPLMAHPAAAFAAAAAIGFGFTSQIAGAFFGALQGALQGAVEATNKRVVAPTEEKPVAKKDGAGEAKPVKASPATKPAAAKPAVVKRVETKPAVVKAAPAKVPAKAKAKIAVVAPVEAKPAAAPVRRRNVAVKTDDLKRISGIGPKLEQVLNGRGILRVADIAAWSDADVERIDTELGFDGRIRRDDWVGQAKALQPKGRA